MIEDIGIIRHGEKLVVGEDRKPLEQSGLTPVQQEKWKKSQQSLGLSDPELTYGALPRIEAMAEEMYKALPDDAIVVFSSTFVPRARFTADLLATELTRHSVSDNRNIGVAFIWEPKDVADKPDSLSNIPMYPKEIGDAMTKKVREIDTHDDGSLEEYLNLGNSPKTHPKEDEITMRVMNDDLAGEDSFMRRRADLLKDQIAKLKDLFASEDRPVFFYGVGHHSGLIALDIALNGRERYDSVDEMPKPLSLWKANNIKELH